MATVFLKKDTLRILCEPGELQLPERLEQDDGRRIGEVERPQPRVFAHGDADRLLLMRCLVVLTSSSMASLSRGSHPCIRTTLDGCRPKYRQSSTTK